MKKIALLALSFFCTALFGGVVIKSGDRIAFLGDSITNLGNRQASGYVNMVMLALKLHGIDAEKIPAGVSGNKSHQMLARLEKDVISANPDWLLLSCGVNDVWHGVRGVKLEDYRKNIHQIIKKAKAKNIKVCIMTSTMIGEIFNIPNNRKIDEYNAVLRELAQKEGCVLVDTGAEMQRQLREYRKKYPASKGSYLTCDGVHMNPLGDAMMASTILKAWGMDETAIAEADMAWRKLKFRSGMFFISYETFIDLAAYAGKKGMPMHEAFVELVNKNIRDSK